MSDTISREDAAVFANGYSHEHSPECICTICSCGAHACPADKIQGRYGNIQSEAQAQYTGQYVKPVRAAKQHHVHTHRPFNGTTTNQEDFKYWGRGEATQPSQTARGNNNVFAGGLPFEATTTAKHDFRAWDAKPAQLTRQNKTAQYAPDSRNFQTENSAQFEYKPMKPRASCAPDLTAARSLPFDGQTTNQADYQRYNAKPARAYGGSRRYAPRQETRDWQTEARGQFVEKPFDHCPATTFNTKTKQHNGHVLVEPYSDMKTEKQKWRLSTREPLAMGR